MNYYAVEVGNIKRRLLKEKNGETMTRELIRDLIELSYRAGVSDMQDLIRHSETISPSMFLENVHLHEYKEGSDEYDNAE